METRVFEIAKNFMAAFRVVRSPHSLFHHEILGYFKNPSLHAGIDEIVFFLNFLPCNFLLLRDKGLIVVMEGYEGFDGLDVEHGLVDVAEEGLLANVLNPTSSLLKIVPEVRCTVVLVFLEEFFCEFKKLFLTQIVNRVLIL